MAIFSQVSGLGPANAGAAVAATSVAKIAATASSRIARLKVPPPFPSAVVFVTVFLLSLRCVLYLSLACTAGALCSLFVWLCHISFLVVRPSLSLTPLYWARINDPFAKRPLGIHRLCIRLCIFGVNL
jgi:hypothetical protein